MLLAACREDCPAPVVECIQSCVAQTKTSLLQGVINTTAAAAAGAAGAAARGGC
jgi:hypothetical protein